MKSEFPQGVLPQHQAAMESLLQRLYAQYPKLIISIILYGSVARGDFKPDSDIDILIVADSANTDFKWAVRGIASRVSLEFNTIFNLHFYSRSVWEEQRREKKKVWLEVERDGVELKFVETLKV